MPGRAARTSFLESFELEDAAGTCGQSLVRNILSLLRLTSCPSLNAFHILPPSEYYQALKLLGLRAQTAEYTGTALPRSAK
jgi:hypothetical protein